jgi:ABC-2 type transport system permease protein
MTKVSLWEKLVAVLRLEFISSMRYSTHFILRAVVLVIELAGIFYLARAIGGSYRPQGMEYYSFLLIGTAFLDLTIASVGGFVQSTMQAQVSGTFEVLMSTSTPGHTVLFLNVASTLLGRLVHTLAYVLLGTVVFHAQLHMPDPLAFGFVVTATLITVASVGMIAAALQVAMFRGASFLWLLSVSTGLLSGVMFPIDVLPTPLLRIAQLNPFAHLLSLLRNVFTNGQTLGQMPNLYMTLLMVVALAFFGPWSFAVALRQARRRGTLAQY